MLIGKLIRPTTTSGNVVLIVLLLTGLIAVYQWFVLPHTSNLMAAQKYNAVTDDLEKKNEILIKTVVRKRENLKELKNKLNKIENMIFESNEAQEFFSDIQVIAEETNCAILSLNFSPINNAKKNDISKTSDQINANHAKLNITGSYRNIMELINRLQDRLKRVMMDFINISTINNSSGKLNCQLTITVFVKKGKEIRSDD